MSKNALIIDDSQNNVRVLAGYLKLESVDSTHIMNPTEIEDHLNDLTDIDMIFLDLEMPELDGYEVFHILKSKPQLADVPIIVYSVHANELKNAHEMGFDGFIGKPLSDKKFSSQLARILNGEGVWEAK